MAVDAETRRSFFTDQLANKLEREGISTPSFILDLLDKPFATFNEADRELYEKQIKQKELLALFAGLLQNIYESSGKSARHSWKGMCHLLKDSPIKVCVSFVITREEEHGAGGEGAVSAPTLGEVLCGEAPVAPRAAPSGEAERADVGASRKSYFTKKLERKLDERAIKVPASIISLLDKPFEDFSPEDQDIYEAEFKGRQLTILFSDILDELYEETGRVSSGWNGLCRYLKETPMKLIATYVVQEEERLEEVAVSDTQDPAPQPVREKLNVRRYQQELNEQKEPPSRRRRK